MKNTYLVLAIIGFILPNIFVVIESIDSGNILLYGHFTDTIEGMFANRISTIFIIDLFFTVLVFFIWSYRQSKLHGIKHLGVVWLLTMLFGLAGSFPLFLYYREKALNKNLIP